MPPTVNPGALSSVEDELKGTVLAAQALMLGL